MLKKIYEKIVKKCYDWAMAVSARSNAVWALCVISFVESSFFPIPPDIFLIPLVLAQRSKAYKLALYCTVASVLGGFFGYAIGFFLDQTILPSLIEKMGMTGAFARFKVWYVDYGAWCVFMAGLTPFPYKVITIASGTLHLNLVVFAIASVLSRGLRFFFIAWLLYKWGEPMKAYIEKNLGWLSILFVVLLFGCLFLIKFL